MPLTARLPAGTMPGEEGRRYTTTMTVIDSPSITHGHDRLCWVSPDTGGECPISTPAAASRDECLALVLLRHSPQARPPHQPPA
jgi:hypothetical protein